MILRRPYAFLIKYFRVIHLVLFGLFAYITYKANNILSFFKDYIDNNGNIDIVSSEYISYFIFISIILIVAISIVIYFLMRYKKKPRLFYIILIGVGIVSCILFIYLYSNIRVLETSVLSGRSIRLFRDIDRIHFWGLFITCIPILIRGLGFDVKKFNFTKDLQELKLEEKDSEEVEVNIDLSSDGIKRTGRKITRELKYYYLENKFIINIILGVVIVILIFMFPFNTFVVNRDLNEGEVLGTSGFNISVNESYVSDRNRISRNNSYIILKVSIKGKTNKYTLDLDEFVLSSKDNDYIPSLKYYYYFTDVGKGYRNNVLNTNEYEEYILIYNINSEDKDKKLTFNYLGSERDIKLNPKELN